MSPRADEQLERILYILPVAARGGVPIEEVARALCVEPATVLNDLEAATARAYYHPAGSVDRFSIMTDGRTVEVFAPDDFQRPVRLNQREALALGLGLRALAADADVERRAEILAFAARLEAALVAPDTRVAESRIPWQAMESDRAAETDVEYEALDLAFGDDGQRGVLADAIELSRLCVIWYLKPGDAGPAQRTIAPRRLVYAQGTWYVLAEDIERDGARWFRMDRILDARLEEAAAPPASDEIDAHIEAGVPFTAHADVGVTVRYSPRIARWVAERTGQPMERDGSAVVRHRVADPSWIVRHVMQYAGEAVVEEPAEARGWVASAAARAAATATG